MADDGPPSREALHAALREQWQTTEDAVAALETHFDAPAHGDGGWTVGDLFRHLTANAHNYPARIRTALADGAWTFGTDEGNALGVARFRALDAKMLRIELNTAHGVDWMYVQRFTDADLARAFPRPNGDPWTLDRIIRQLACHEAWHVAEALEAAGLPESAVVPVETAHRWV